MTDVVDKMRYVQAYIHQMKGKHVQIIMPRDIREITLLHHLYTHAKKVLNS